MTFARPTNGKPAARMPDIRRDEPHCRVARAGQRRIGQPLRYPPRAWLCALLVAAWAMPAAACEAPDSLAGSLCQRLSDTWQQGRNDLLLPFHTHHLRFAYTREQIDHYRENTWGIGYGRSRYDRNGNWHALYAMGFRDSHDKFEPVIGYGYQWMWGSREALHAGLGYTVLVTARSDIAHYAPVPGILPIASVNYGRYGLNMAYVPGGSGNGNVLFLWGRIGF